MTDLIIVIFSAVVLVLAVRGGQGKNDNSVFWSDSGDGD
jgi:hypothetical protein